MLNNRKMALKALQPLFSLVANVVLAYLVYFVARMAYLLENYSFFKENVPRRLNVRHPSPCVQQRTLHSADAVPALAKRNRRLSSFLPLVVRRRECHWVVLKPLRCRLLPLYAAPNHNKCIPRVRQREQLRKHFHHRSCEPLVFRVAFHSRNMGYIQALQNA